MNDPEHFLARWSRRKRELAADAGNTEKPEQDADVSPVSDDAELAQGGGNRQPFDPASLPPIDSIGAATDLRPFLAAGVPADLTRAALRRVWSSDPAIRDFVGLAENSWDFNAPDGVHGFGAIDAGEVRKLLSRLLGEPEIGQATSPASDAASGANQAMEVTSEPVGTSPTACQEPETLSSAQGESDRDPVVGDAHSNLRGSGKIDPAPQHDASNEPAPMPRRNHGGALPE